MGTNYERTEKGSPVLEEARQWEGWGTALKPAWEPICLARKPLIGTVAENVLEYGTGALNIDGCRISSGGASPSIARRETARRTGTAPGHPGEYGNTITNRISVETYTALHAGEALGRWPANLCHDGSEEVIAVFPETGSGAFPGKRGPGGEICTAGMGGQEGLAARATDAGSAARFFFSAKANADDRWGSKHPTVKPVDLMRWIARLVTPPGGTVLDPFAGSGTTGVACLAEGFDCILIEREEEYLADIRARLAHYEGNGGHSLQVKNRNAKPAPLGPLFGGDAA